MLDFDFALFAVPPTSIVYSNNPAVYTRTIPIAANSPTVTGGGAVIRRLQRLRAFPAEFGPQCAIVLGLLTLCRRRGELLDHAGAVGRPVAVHHHRRHLGCLLLAFALFH